jgi:hypothetical protein
VTREVFYEATYQEWVTAETPSPDLEELVRAGLAQLGTRDDFPAFCVAYNDGPGAPEHYETKLAGTNVFAEFYVYESLNAVDVVDLARGSSFS